MGALQREAGSEGTLELSQHMEGQPDAAMPRMSSFSSQCRDAGRRLTRFDFVACAIITGFILLSMVFGTTNTIRDIGLRIGKYGAPFDCQARVHPEKLAMLELLF